MKTLQATSSPRVALKLFPGWPPVVTAVALLCALPVLAQELKPATNAVAVNADTSATATNPPAATALSPGIGEILRLADAGVSTDVLLAYIQAAPATPQLTSEDIVALKTRNVPDEIIKLLLNRGAVARQAATVARNETLKNFVESRRATTGGVDPESYEYFRTYYLQPRAIASANERLYPYYGPYGRGFTYGPAWNYGVPVSRRPGYRGFR